MRLLGSVWKRRLPLGLPSVWCEIMKKTWTEDERRSFCIALWCDFEKRAFKNKKAPAGFGNALIEKMMLGAIKYGDASLSCAPTSLLNEVAEEHTDVVGWSMLLDRQLCTYQRQFENIGEKKAVKRVKKLREILLVWGRGSAIAWKDMQLLAEDMKGITYE